MPDEATPSPAQPSAKRKGAHKPDCVCGWCATRKANLAKKNAATAVTAASPKDSGENSAPSSATKPAASMRAKIDEMKRSVTPPANAQPGASQASEKTAAQKPQQSWYEKLFSGPTTFFED